MAKPLPVQDDLTVIRTMFLQMCARAESMVRIAVRSVLERDPVLGRRVVELDKVVDQMEIDIDRRCLAVLQQGNLRPAELRRVVTIMKMVTDLERIGDLGGNIAKRGLKLTAGVGVEPGLDLSRMAEIAADMLRDAADAFATEDAAAAREVIRQDAEVDELNKAAFKRWIAAMGAHPDQVERAVMLTTMSKSIERVADHACNLGEMVVFMVEGEDMRHGG